MSQPPQLLTVGEIARRLQTKVHRVEYVIRSRHIEASGWAGHARVFSEAAFERIKSEIKRMDSDRERSSIPTRRSLGGVFHEGV
jgi:hypothetical protein